MSESKEVSKWADTAMWRAEPSERDKGTRAVLVSANPDPLGEIAALNKTYIGQTVADLTTITDDERRAVLGDIAKTVLKMPLEIVNLHFLIEGVHRGITHQMVRQRTAAYAQESMRFAVKEDIAVAVAYPPSLRHTVPWSDWLDVVAGRMHEQGLDPTEGEIHDHAINEAGKRDRPQLHRLYWDEAVEAMSQAYTQLIEDGMPAEEARGLTPTNVLTKLHYTTNLRAFYDTMAMRVSDQAQFEWRELITAMVKAMREFGEKTTYFQRVPFGQEDLSKMQGWKYRYTDLDRSSVYEVSSAWQFEALTQQLLPIDFKLGHRGFGSDVDRPSRIGERVDAFAKMGVPASEWLRGSPEHSIPAIHPDEWLLDPNSARLDAHTQFNIFGERVPKEISAWHWRADNGGELWRLDHNGRAIIGKWTATGEDITVEYDEEN
jgi:flavin-dependent thymidylate synthase